MDKIKISLRITHGLLLNISMVQLQREVGNPVTQWLQLSRWKATHVVKRGLMFFVRLLRQGSHKLVFIAVQSAVSHRFDYRIIKAPCFETR